MKKQPSSDKKRNWFDFSEVFTYYFRKKDPDRPTSSMIRAMHWSNKLSIVVFLIALVVWIVRRVG